MYYYILHDLPSLGHCILCRGFEEIKTKRDFLDLMGVFKHKKAHNKHNWEMERLD